MPKDEITASRQEARAFLRAVYDGLGEPPLHSRHRAMIVAVLDVLGELDLERRFQFRERIGELLAERELPEHQ
jgi:hypothetical protein